MKSASGSKLLLRSIFFIPHNSFNLELLEPPNPFSAASSAVFQFSNINPIFENLPPENPMAASQERNQNKPIFTVVEEDEAEAQRFIEGQSDGCGCFRSFPCFGSARDGPPPDYSAWIARRAKSVREFTEVVAGPKWKNFVRKFGGYFTKKKRRGFQYDSFDYALNFDDGLNEEEEQERLVRGFPVRFAPPPGMSST